MGISTGVGWDTSVDLRFIISKQPPEAADETAKAKVDHILVPLVAVSCLRLGERARGISKLPDLFVFQLLVHLARS